MRGKESGGHPGRAPAGTGLADSAAPRTGEIVFTDWVAEHGPELGRAYANELDRHFRPAPVRTALTPPPARPETGGQPPVVC